ncbi:hypothetical protein [Mesorhizobium silamurunense]|uniref:hypothetical protein n=1 Tax=Mesorhizobium silamurunense TaxID=499528 RepID=UPI0017805461|nr:hypothetical protein [Mesorhizobium silamurunense]
MTDKPRTDQDYQHAVILMLLASEQLMISKAVDAKAMRDDLERVLNRYTPASFKRDDYKTIQSALIDAVNVGDIIA